MTKATLLPVARGSKEYDDLRHRAAYVMATGWLPTHLRDHMGALLSKVIRASNGPASMDRRSGSVEVLKTRAKELSLDKHPMIQKVREYVDHGYTIQARREPKARRPYGKVFMYKDTGLGITQRITVQSDGSVLDHW